MIVGTLLAVVKAPEQLDAALRAYDQVQRPRTLFIVELSRITGQIMTGQGAGFGVDIEKVKEALASRWAFIDGFDIEKHKARRPGRAMIRSTYVPRTHHVDAGQFPAKCEETYHL